jgi:hypothetical protein
MSVRVTSALIAAALLSAFATEAFAQYYSTRSAPYGYQDRMYAPPSYGRYDYYPQTMGSNGLVQNPYY